MYRCVLVKPGGETQELETQFLGDTTIVTAAGMVAHELGNRTQADEIYFFGLQRHTLSPERAYYICSQNTTHTITPERLSAYLTNIVGYEAPKALQSRKSYTYTDLIELGLTGERQMRVPLSISVNAETRYPVPANPFDWVSSDPVVAENAEALIADRGAAIFFDTPLADALVFCCAATDVLGSTSDPALASNLARVYFPTMAARGIRSMAALRGAHTDARTPTPPPSQQQPLAILEYSQTVEETLIGVTEHTTVFHPDLPVHVPLELLFRSVPASAKVPFIKFNMGRSRSRLYRLYAPMQADGTKKPSLSSRRVGRLQTAVAMQEGIGYAVFGGDSLCTLEVQPDANLRLRFIAQHPVPFDALPERLNDMMGDVLTQLNQVLLDTGFQFPERFELNDEGAEVQNVVLRGVREHVERFEPAPIVRCASDIVYTTDLGDSIAELVYHRVGYYDTMSAVEKYVTTRLRQSRPISEIVRGVEKGFGLSSTEATEAVANWAAKVQEELNAHANQRLKVVTSGGVDVAITRNRATRQAAVSAEGIISIAQARLLSQYMRALLAASCSPGAAERYQTAVGVCEPEQAVAVPPASRSRPGTPEAAAAAAPAPAVPVTIEDNRIVVDDDAEDQMDDLMDFYGGFDEDDDVGEAELGELLLDDDADEAAKTEAIASVRDGTPSPAAAGTPAATPFATPAAAPAAAPAAPPPAPRGADVVGMQLSNPNYFLNRLYKRDPRLFVAKVKKGDKFKTYSRICPFNLRRQPVVLTQAEKERMEREAPGSFDPSPKALMLYGSGDGPPNWYMCPRYWCLKTDLPLSQAQVDAGECGGKIIPHNAKTVPEDAFIFEFNAEINQQHRAKDGSYAQHYPGFVDPSVHPDGLCVPCCFKNVDQAKVRQRINMCLQSQREGAAAAPAPAAATPKRTSRLYVKDANKYPLSAGDIGFLPPVVQKLLGTDNSKCMVSQRDKTIATNVRCVLRGGVGGNKARSFLNAVAVAAKKPLDTLIDTLVAKVTPDTIMQLQEGTLVETLMPRQGTDPTAPPLAPEDLREAAATRLRGMLMDPKAVVGYQYVWDLVRLHAFDQPINLIVLVLDEMDGTDNVRLLCPDASSSNPQHYPDRGTLVLLSKHEYYEPVMLYRSSAAGGEAPLAPIERLLGQPTTKEPGVKAAVDRLGDIANGCGRPAIPAEPVPSLATVGEAIARGGGQVIGHVVSFSGQLVALHVALPDGKRVAVPIAATAMPSAETGAKLELVGSASTLQLLDATLAAMRSYAATTGLRLEPASIVAEDGMGVAILTTNDRVIPILPSSLTGAEAGEYRGIEVVSVSAGGNPVEADRVSVLGTGQDEARLAAAEAIRAHGETYELFRAWLRAKLLDPGMTAVRRAVTKAATLKVSVGERIRTVEAALAKGFEGKVVIRVAADGEGGAANEPVVTADPASTFYIPEGLFTLEDIMMRAADELVRYPNAAKFILGRSMFYSTQPGEYTIGHDELILPEAMLAQEVRSLASAGLMSGLVGPSAALSTNTALDAEAVMEAAAQPPAQPAQPQAGPPASATAATPRPSPLASETARTASPKQATPSGCQPPGRRTVGNSDKLRKHDIVPAGTNMLTPEYRTECIWELLAHSLGQTIGSNLTLQAIRAAVSRGYRQLGDADAAKALETWRAEGKLAIAKGISNPTGPQLAAISAQPDYYPTNIDLFFLSIAYGLTIVVASSAKTHQTGTEFIAYGNASPREGAPQVMVLKRGKRHLNKPTLYNLLASPNLFVIRTITPKLQAIIDDNRLSNPYHEAIRKVVLSRT